MPVDPAPKTDDLLERLAEAHDDMLDEWHAARGIETSRAALKARIEALEAELNECIGYTERAQSAALKAQLDLRAALAERKVLEAKNEKLTRELAHLNKTHALLAKMHFAADEARVIAEAALSRARAEAFEEAARELDERAAQLWVLVNKHPEHEELFASGAADMEVMAGAIRRRSFSTKGDQARPDAQTPAEGGTRDG